MLRNEAYLEVFQPLPGRPLLSDPDDVGNRKLTFQFKDGFEMDRNVEFNYFLGPRGQFAREAWDQITQDEPNESSTRQRRTGYHLDSGMGNWLRTCSFITGAEESDSIIWGDQDSSAGPDNVTSTDASGSGIHKEDRADIFEYNVSRAVTDSTLPARLYYNQWNDGIEGTEAGVFGRPMPVAVYDANISSDTGDSSAVEGTVTLAHTATLPGTELWEYVSWFNGILDAG